MRTLEAAKEWQAESPQVDMILLIVGTLVVSAITGLVVSMERRFFLEFPGQILHGLLSIVCFALVGVAFWRFGWKVGLLDLILLLIAGNLGQEVGSLK